MSKRRRKRNKRPSPAAARMRTGQAQAPSAGGQGAPTATEAAPAATDTPAARGRAPLVPWRAKVRELLDGMRGFARQQHGKGLETLLKAEFGDPPEAGHEADLERFVDDMITTRGSAGDGRSISSAYAEANADLEPLDRDQVRRWESERRRGVFLVQRCFQDRIEAFDPIEGAALTLHLLDRLPAGRAAEIRTGAVLTTTYLPYVARLVATGLLELFADPEALAMFREQVQQSGATWHEAPPPAPHRDA